MASGCALWEKFYAPHRRAHEPLHNDDCIYTPGVVVFKSDVDYPQLLPEEKWYSANVLTCAAPNLRERPSNEMNAGDGDAAAHISREDLQALHEKRMRRVLEIAWRKGNEVVILGAFGCGAFRNPPAVVAQAMQTVVQEYRMNFETIEFAVYCGAQYDTNYRVSRFEWVKDYTEIHDNKRKIVLMHYPVFCYNGQFRRGADGTPLTYMLHGHIHKTEDQVLVDKFCAETRATMRKSAHQETAQPVSCQMINCFCMYSDYTPLTLEEWVECDQRRQNLIYKTECKK